MDEALRAWERAREIQESNPPRKPIGWRINNTRDKVFHHFGPHFINSFSPSRRGLHHANSNSRSAPVAVQLHRSTTSNTYLRALIHSVAECQCRCVRVCGPPVGSHVQTAWSPLSITSTVRRCAEVYAGRQMSVIATSSYGPQFWACAMRVRLVTKPLGQICVRRGRVITQPVRALEPCKQCNRSASRID